MPVLSISEKPKVARVKKVAWEVGINVSLRKIPEGGRLYVDVRKYFRKDGGEWSPSKKGICIPIDESQEVQFRCKRT